MRNMFAEALYQEATKNPDIYVVVADISPVGNMAKFTSEYPDRFINVGVAEQSMIGICAGLALKGCQPFAYTIATFSLYRPFEMVRDDLTMEDVAVAGAIPNMQIIAPCDPAEVTEATKWCARQKNGPVYLRLGKAGEPDLTSQAEPWVFGKLRRLRRGSDVAILTYGVIAGMAAQLADKFTAAGKSVSLYSCHTVKPLDRQGIVDVLKSHEHVIIIEEHVPQGGLASQTKQLAWDSQARCRLDTFTLKDEFIHNFGRHPDMLAAHGLSLGQISHTVGLG
jgi:transketolase